MAETYVTLTEAAELEGIKSKTMARRTQRYRESFVTKTEKSGNWWKGHRLCGCFFPFQTSAERLEGAGKAEGDGGSTTGDG